MRANVEALALVRAPELRFHLPMEDRRRHDSDLATFARDHPLVVLSTVTPDGRSESALVSVAVADDDRIIVNCKSDARKLTNIRQNPAVSLVIGTTGDVSFQVEGNARIPEGAARDDAVRAYRARFPQSRAGEAGIEVIVVSPTWIRVYDPSR